ncbi:hypothetical protein D3C71_1761010 [compost metagenome]
MRPHIDGVGARRELGRTHLIQEDEGADHPVRMEGQDPPDLEPAEIFPARVDHQFDHVGGPLIFAPHRHART